MKRLIYLILIAGLTTSLIFAQEKGEKEEKSEKENTEFHFNIPAPPAPIPFMDKKSEEQYLKTIDAATKAELEQIKEYDKEKYQELLMDAYFNSFNKPFFRIDKEESERLKRQEEMSKLEISTELLKQKYLHASKGDKDNYKKTLSNLLYKLFDLKQQDKKNEIEELQSELEKLKKSISVRSKNRDKIVERRLQELIGEDDYLEWE